MHCDSDNCGQWATWGNDGQAGKKGDTAGETGKIVEDASVGVVPTETLGIAVDSTVTNLYAAGLNVGGFIGTVDSNTFVENCACVVNDVFGKNGIDAKHEYNTVNCGNFIGVNAGTVVNVIASCIKDEELVKYGISTWFSDLVDNRAESSVSVLNDFSDSVGLVYDNGITTENTVSLTCSVLYKVGEKCDVTIPDYVYSGKFITSVTEIADMAFTDSDLIDSVTVGDLLERI